MHFQLVFTTVCTGILFEFPLFSISFTKQTKSLGYCI